MKTRILTAVVAVLLFVPFCIFSASPVFVFLLFAGIIVTVAIFELLKCTGLHRNVFESLLAYPTGLAAVILTRIVETPEEYFRIMSFVWFAFLFLSLVNATFSKGRVPVTDAAVAALMIVYVSFAMASIVLLRDLSALSEGERVVFGGKIYLLAFLFAWMPDIGGYFFGRFFGKHKLIPHVSPKKTVEGFVGGLFSALVVSVIYGFAIGLGRGDFKGFLVLGVLAILSGAVSVCGDLLASLVKRHYGIKDYGFVFPGHGGVMDRFDSVMAVAPFLYILSSIANSFGLFSDFLTL